MENTAIDTIKISDASIDNNGTITLTAAGNNISLGNDTANSITIDMDSLNNSFTYSGNLTHLGNGIVCNTATGNCYTTTGFSSTYSYGDCCESESVEETIKKEVKKEFEEIMESEDEMMPLIKNYLRKYLEEVMDNPGELVKRDKEIERQKEEIKGLKEQVEALRKEIETIKNNSIYLGDPGEYHKLDGYSTYPNNGIIYTSGDPSWYYNSISSTQGIDKNPPSTIA
jgi:hypothetical protein